MTKTEERVMVGGQGLHRPRKDKVRAARARLASATRVGYSTDTLNSLRRELNAAKLERLAEETVSDPLGLTEEQRRRIKEIMGYGVVA